MKVLFIDPWGKGNTIEYTNGLCGHIGEKQELTLITSFNYKNNKNNHFKVKRRFFLISNIMRRTRLRTFVRGLEYLMAYTCIIIHLSFHEYDVVHIRWLLNDYIDKFFLPKIKRKAHRLVLTSDNAVPHVDGDAHIANLSCIYDCFDIIILHGERIKEEFEKYFPKHKSSIYIQKHGVDYSLVNLSMNEETVEKSLINFVNKRRNVVIFGAQYYNKGTDRVVKAWLNTCFFDNYNLIIAGRQVNSYIELNHLGDQIRKAENIYWINDFVDENTLNYIIFKSDLILLPYRHASMSGVIFTAASHSKPFLATDVGAFKEYVEGLPGAYIVNNIDHELISELQKILNNNNSNQLNNMGAELHRKFEYNYSWGIIAEKMMNNCY